MTIPCIAHSLSTSLSYKSGLLLESLTSYCALAISRLFLANIFAISLCRCNVRDHFRFRLSCICVNYVNYLSLTPALF